MRRTWILAIVFPALLSAQTLTLDDAVQKAMEHNAMLKAEEARVTGAVAQEKEARSYLLPQVEASSGFVRTNQPASVFAMKLNQKAFDMNAFFSADPNNPAYLNTYLTSISFTLPLYTGGQVRAGMAAAREQKEAFQQELQKKRQETLSQVTRAYLGVLLAKEYVSLAEKAHDTVAQHVKMARDYFETGMIVESDLLRAKLELAKMDDQLIRVGNAEKTARTGLAILMGEPPESVWEVASVEPPASAPLPPEAEDITLALASRPDLKFAEHMENALAQDVNRITGQRLPQVGLSITQEWYDKDFLGTHGDSATAMVGLKIPLFTGGRITAQAAQARARKDEMTQMRAALKDGVVMDVRRSRYAIEEASARVGVARDNEDTAVKNLSIVEERYKKGILKMTDLLDADTALSEARTRLLSAQFDYLQAERDYRLALGKEM